MRYSIPPTMQEGGPLPPWLDSLINNYKPKQHRAVAQPDATSTVDTRNPRGKNLAGEKINYRDDFDGNFLSYLASGHKRRESYGKMGDLYRYYGGDPLKHDILYKSEYKPSNSSNPNAEYVAIKDKDFRESIRRRYKQIFEEGNIPETVNKINDNTYSISEYYNHQIDSRTNTKALGRIFISKGEDEKGKYVSYYDVFDRATGPAIKSLGDKLGATKPFEVYDRIYLDQDTTQSTKQQKRFGGKIYDKENKNSYIKSNKDSKSMPRYRKKLRRYQNNSDYNFGGFLKKALPVAGAAASFIPGVGPAAAMGINAAASGISNAIPPEEQERRDPRTLSPSSLGYKYGGEYAFGGKITTDNQADMLTFQDGGRMPITKPLPGGGKKYSGPKHEQGGVPVDNQGNPTSPQTATAEVEGGETEQDGYIFSDSLKVPKTDGKTFAEVHEMMLNRGASKKDIKKLQMLQEKVQAQEGVQGGDEQPKRTPGKPRGKGRRPSKPASPEMKSGGKMREYGNGGWAEPRFGSDPLGESSSGSSSSAEPGGMGGNWLKTAADVAGYAVPSIMKGAMALTNPDVKKTPKVQPQEVPVQSKAFTEGERSLASSYRTMINDPNATRAQKLAAQSQYIKGRSNLAGKEANFRSKQEQFNAQQQSRADRINTQSFQQDRELQAQESAAEKQMLMSAVTDPINAFRKNQAGKRSQIANILTSANQIQNATDRRNAIKRGLRAMGLDEQRIQEIIARNETS